MDKWEPDLGLTDSPRRKKKSNAGLGFTIAGVLGMAAAAVAAWFFRDTLYEVFATAPVAADAAVIVDAAPPPQDAGPPVVRAEGEKILREHGESSRSQVLKRWLAEPNVVQRLVAATVLVSEDKNPRKVLGFVELGEPIDAIERDNSPKKRKTRKKSDRDKVYLGPTFYRRYDEPVRALGKLDDEFLARTYRSLAPYLADAYAEIAKPGETFESVLTIAIDHLLVTEIPAGKVELVPVRGFYTFADPDLEALGEAQKCLIRMGPKNARAVQDTLRRFARAVQLPIDP